MINWGLLPVQLRTEVTYNSAIIFNLSFQNSLSSASKAYIGWNKSESVHWKHQLMDYQEQINTVPHPEKKNQKKPKPQKTQRRPHSPQMIWLYIRTSTTALSLIKSYCYP